MLSVKMKPVFLRKPGRIKNFFPFFIGKTRTANVPLNVFHVISGKKIVEHHGGIIYASAELSVGAVFTIIIPV